MLEVLWNGNVGCAELYLCKNGETCEQFDEELFAQSCEFYYYEYTEQEFDELVLKIQEIK